MLHDFLAHFPAPTRLFVAAERPGGISVIVGIDADRAGPDLARHHVSGLQIRRPDAGGQAIFRVVGEFRDRVQVSIVEGLDADHGAEYFFPYDLHRAIGLGEDGWLNKIALVAHDLAAGDYLCAFLSPGFEKAGYAVVLFLRDQWSQIDGRI